VRSINRRPFFYLPPSLPTVFLFQHASFARSQQYSCFNMLPSFTTVFMFQHASFAHNSIHVSTCFSPIAYKATKYILHCLASACGNMFNPNNDGEMLILLGCHSTFDASVNDILCYSTPSTTVKLLVVVFYMQCSL